MELNQNGSLQEFSMYISKSSLSDGVMRWSAVNSDTDPDLYGERMTIELYRSMLDKIDRNEMPPMAFRDMVVSDYWKGGMPYVSLAHYPDLNGSAVPGMPTEIFIDGKQLKAKGTLFDNPLGHAVWKALKQDEINTKSQTDDKKIRISIAFLDLAHKHSENGNLFRRFSLNDVCPECQKGVKGKIYVDGYLVHLALTRVPVNPRTIMKSEDVMATKSKTISTRKEDAASIVGEELADTIAKSALETKSDILVEMSEVGDEADSKDKSGDESGKSKVKADSLVEESKNKKDSPAADEADPNDPEEDKMEPKGKGAKKNCSLTDGDVELIRSIVEDVVTSKSVVAEAPVTEKSALDLATDALYNSVNAAVSMKGVTVEQMLESINPALAELGGAITNIVKESVGQIAKEPTTNDQGFVVEALTSLTETMKSLAQEVATLKAQTSQPSVNPVVNRTPVPRSIQVPVVNQSQATNVNPNSVANIVRRSVSSALPLK